MAPRRFVLVVTDTHGSHRGRFTVTTAGIRRAVGLCAVAALCAVALLGHVFVVRAQRRLGLGLGAHNAAMAALATTLEQQKQAVAAVVDENTRALVLLSRKSHMAPPHENSADADADEEALLASQEAEAMADTPATPVAWHQPGVGDALVMRADALLAQGLELEGALADLLEYWRDAEQRLTYTPSIRPARSPWTTSSYGVRIDPVFHYWVMHKGLDLGGFIGMLVYAPADGIVIWTGTRGGYGQVVVLDHGMGLQTHYAHLSKYLVRKGDVIRRGDPIAEMGTTGKSTGPHLHYEVRQDGVPMDPRQFILD